MANKILVIGFVGAMRSPRDKNQGVVQIGNRLKSSECSDLQVNIFSHWHWKKAFRWICQVMDRDKDGHLSDKVTEGETKIVVYGHSMGAGAAIKLARRLEKANIRVELAVQIDSVGIGDDVVPGNVKSAANFYQSTGWLIGAEKKVRAQDESKTKILGNTLVKHVGHQALARDPQISDFITEKVLSLCGHCPTIVAPERAQRVVYECWGSSPAR
ncbi:MAG: hypothetical protein U0V70_11180 [Terriglobia bacterium]